MQRAAFKIRHRGVYVICGKSKTDPNQFEQRVCIYCVLYKNNFNSNYIAMAQPRSMLSSGH